MSLTDIQKKLLRFIVEQVNEGKLDDEEFWCKWGSVSKVYDTGFLARENIDLGSTKAISIPFDIQPATVKALEKDGYVSCEWIGSYLARCALTGEASKAVNSNFAEFDRAANYHLNSPTEVMNLAPLKLWQEKLDYFQRQQAITTDPATKIQLAHEIEECKRKIAELFSKFDNLDSNFKTLARSTPSNPPQANSSIKKIKIFLASSSELKDDRDRFEIFIRRKNDELIDRSIYLEPVRWENFIDAMSPEGLQEEYNKAVAESDIFVSLFYTKVGRYTEEEFSRAFGTFQENNKPLVYTYFQQKPIDPGLVDPSLHKFKEKLKELKHYPTHYQDINDLKHQFGEQLVKILPKILSLKA